MSRKHKINLSGLSNATPADEASSSSKRPRVDGRDDNELNRWTGRPFSAKYYSILQGRQKLPVYQFKDQLVKAVKENQIVIVEGETGTSCARRRYVMETGRS